MQGQYIYYKQSGKFYTSHSGEIPDELFQPYYEGSEISRVKLAERFNGKFPGLNTTADNFFVAIIPDDGDHNGWPLLWHPVS